MLIIAAFVAAATVLLPAGNATLPPSVPRQLLVLYGSAVPIARSYDGRPWERTQGGAQLTPPLDCPAGTGEGCHLQTPVGATYRIETFDAGPQPNALSLASRFLTQATFGPTTATLTSVDATSQEGLQAWINEQMALPPTFVSGSARGDMALREPGLLPC